MNHRDATGPRLFSAQTKTVVWDRRRSPRHSPSEDGLWLGWRKDGDFFVVHAELMNISQGGALILVEEPPHRGESVWLRLAGPTPIEDVSAVVIETMRIGRGEHGVRVAFREPFPPEFYHAAMVGLEPLEVPGRLTQG